MRRERERMRDRGGENEREKEKVIDDVWGEKISKKREIMCLFEYKLAWF